MITHTTTLKSVPLTNRAVVCNETDR